MTAGQDDAGTAGSARLRIAVAGLGFGQDFVPIYASHPAVDEVLLVEPDDQRRHEVARCFGLADGYSDIDQAYADPQIDAVHILAPVPLHAELAVRGLDAGKHIACAVPMATSLPDLQAIIEAEDRSGRCYMMMETTLFGREYFAVQEMLRQGLVGDLTLYRGFHIQNLDGFPIYWQGFPPMHYVTHALSPILGLLETTVATVQARGSGRLTADHATGGFDNPFPTEAGLFSLTDSDVLAEIQMSFFQTGRGYIEGFSLYGDRGGVEWPADNVGPLTVFAMEPSDGVVRGNRVTTRSYEPPDRADRLPEPLRRFVRPTDVRLPGMTAATRLNSHHGGSHPYLVDEFVRSIIEHRRPVLHARRSAELTAPGICGHDSALASGTAVTVPTFR